MRLRALIIGAGGHARVVADILRRCEEKGADLEPIGYVDDNPAFAGQSFVDLPVLGTTTDECHIRYDVAIMAIGDNRTRKKIFDRLRAREAGIANAIHPGAVIAPDVSLGQGVVICAGAIVNTGAVIGDDVILNTACSVDHHCKIASHAHIAPGVRLGGNVNIGTGALLGISSAVIPGQSIGEWATVGAGAAVIDDIPPYATAVGVPARVISRPRLTRRV